MRTLVLVTLWFGATNAEFRMACDAAAKTKGHYKCMEDGLIQCLPGWTGDVCDVPICKTGCDPLLGYCKQPDECICKIGYGGELCTDCVPLPGCMNGHCRKSFECHCNEGWTGLFCNKPVCASGCDKSRGYCSQPNECKCRIGWAGKLCSECQLLPGCIKGYCDKPLECKCLPGWTGFFCERAICADGCSKDHGYCEKPGTCRCDLGWHGASCDTCFPYPGCVNGNCTEPWKCDCREGWTGFLCDKPVDPCAYRAGVCRNGGTCRNVIVDEDPAYRCVCPAGFSGNKCEVRVTTTTTTTTTTSTTTAPPPALRTSEQRVVSNRVDRRVDATVGNVTATHPDDQELTTAAPPPPLDPETQAQVIADNIKYVITSFKRMAKSLFPPAASRRMDLTEGGAVARPRSRRSGMERCLLVLTLVLLSSSVALVLALTQVVKGPAVETPPTPSQATPNDSASTAGDRHARFAYSDRGLCVTKTCVEVASQLLQYRDEAADPCQNFHAYACGAWQEENKVLGLLEPSESYTINGDYLDNLVDRRILKLLDAPDQSPVVGIAWAQYFYSHCVNELHGTEEELDMAADFIFQRLLGGLKTADAWAAAPADLTSTLLRLRRLTDDSLLDATLMEELYGAPRAVLTVRLAQNGLGGNAKHRRPPRRRTRLAKKKRRRLESRRLTTLTGITRPASDEWDDYGPDVDDERADYDYTALDYGETADNNEQAWVDEDMARDGEASAWGSGSGGGADQVQNISRLYADDREEAHSDKMDDIKEFFKENIAAKGLFPERGSEIELENMIRFLQDLHLILPSPKERDIMATRYYLLQRGGTVMSMQAEYPYIDWMRFLPGVTQIAVKPDDPVYVYFPRYLAQLGDLLRRHEPRVVHNALMLAFRAEHLAAVVSELSDADDTLEAGQRYCAAMTRDTFPEATAALYVRAVGRRKVDQLRTKVSSIMEAVRSELLDSIARKAASGADPLLEMAERKIRNTRLFLLAPEHTWDDQYITRHTPPVNRLWPEPEAGGVLVRPGRYKLVDMLRGQVSRDPTRWPPEAPPFTANAFHIASRNAVGVPLALLTEPYFYDNVPEYVQYAVLGVTMAHELLHGIDNAGFHFDESGAVRRLTANEERMIADKFSCVRNEYVQGLSRVIEVNDQPVLLQMDGDLGLMENGADFSSLALTWAAYSRWRQYQDHESKLPGVNLTDRQIFLLSLAQLYCANIEPWSYVSTVGAGTHPPNPERVNGMVRQTPAFGAAFGCPAGSPMNPFTRCDPVW
ncbi:uncharacterized protein LOC119107449 [Pollicipes pollicipes]|uniref:uncharacterized protein LOC119107449 n=1 Tax=Pollicipes pollicipes TaxID=41117 RepID=UPI00188599B7|nr:uncharacterized protein LOC119107449 [Pollicipes pollicipes]